MGVFYLEERKKRTVEETVEETEKKRKIKVFTNIL